MRRRGDITAAKLEKALTAAPSSDTVAVWKAIASVLEERFLGRFVEFGVDPTLDAGVLQGAEDESPGVPFRPGTLGVQLDPATCLPVAMWVNTEGGANTWDPVWPASGTSTDGVYDILTYKGGGLLGASDVLHVVNIVRPIRIPANFAGSRATALAAPTANAVVYIKLIRNGVVSVIGTVTFAAGSTVGVFSEKGLTSLLAGDTVFVENQAIGDITLAGVAITIKATRPLLPGTVVTIRHNDLDGLDELGAHPAAALTVDTTAFSKNLSSTDNTIQKALNTLDQMDGGGSPLVVSGTGFVKVVEGAVQGAAAYPTASEVHALADTATTANVPDSTDKRYATDAEKTKLSNLSGTNTGDETTATIKTKLGITTLSGSNTGDETHATVLAKAADPAPSGKFLRDDGTYQSVAGGSTPTGTGFRHVTSDVEDATVRNPTAAEVGLSNVTNDAQVKRTEMGAANGVASLDSGGKVPSAQLPAISAAAHASSHTTGSDQIADATTETHGLMSAADKALLATLSGGVTVLSVLVYDLGGPDVNPYPTPKVGKQISITGTTSFKFTANAYLQNTTCNGTIILVKLSDQSTVATLSVTSQTAAKYTADVSLSAGIYEARYYLASATANALCVAAIQLEPVTS